MNVDINILHCYQSDIYKENILDIIICKHSITEFSLKDMQVLRIYAVLV